MKSKAARLTFILSFCTGLLSGALGGLVGIGGGVVMIPLMVHFFKLNQHQAHGTSLMALVFTGVAGAFAYYWNGSIDIMAAACLAASGMVTARFGALQAHALPEWKLKLAFGLFVIIVSVLLLIKPYLAHWAPLSHPVHGFTKLVSLLASGAAAGFLSGMMGVGGGSIMVPALVLVVGLNQYTAQGSSLLAMAPAAMVGSFTHWRLGHVVAKILPSLIVGISMGAFLGGNLAHFFTEADLRRLFALVLIWLGIKDILRAQRMKAGLSNPLDA